MTKNLPEYAFRLGFRLGGPLLPRPAARLATRLFCAPRRLPGRPWEAEGVALSNPMELRGHPWSKDPRPLTAREWRPEGRVRGTLLLLHGWEGRSGQFARLGPALAARGWRAVALDLPAHGDSPGRSTQVHDMALAVRAAAHDLGPIAGVVGHSMGGAVATVACARGLKVGALCLLAAPGDLLGVLHGAADRMGLGGRARRLFFDNLRLDAGTPLAGLQPVACVESFKIPGLILHDPADDQVDYRHGELLARAWRGAVLEPLPKSGHRRILRDERVLQRVPQFFDEALAPAAQPASPALTAAAQ